MEQIALQKVSIRILRREAKVGVVKALVGLADLAPRDRKILPSFESEINLKGSHESLCLDESLRKLQSSSYRGMGYSVRDCKTGFS
jgi:hypothetical protein